MELERSETSVALHLSAARGHVSLYWHDTLKSVQLSESSQVELWVM